MSHALLWLPLLAIFFWLAWAGWNEFQKVEAYRVWAESFDHAKYDVYAALGQKGSELTWGIPTRKGIQNLETFSLKDVSTIRLLVNGEPTSLETPPNKGKAVLEFMSLNSGKTICVPFTEISLAAKWGTHLSRAIATHPMKSSAAPGKGAP